MVTNNPSTLFNKIILHLEAIHSPLRPNPWTCLQEPVPKAELSESQVGDEDEEMEEGEGGSDCGDIADADIFGEDLPDETQSDDMLVADTETSQCDACNSPFNTLDEPGTPSILTGIPSSMGDAPTREGDGDEGVQGGGDVDKPDKHQIVMISDDDLSPNKGVSSDSPSKEEKIKLYEEQLNRLKGALAISKMKKTSEKLCNYYLNTF